MTLGVDIYDAYQDIPNPQAFLNSPYDYAYVKGTDGGGTARYPPDAFVRLLQGLGLPCGLYHYAQFNPTPETQARVLAAKVNALDARDLPPALDLEDPFPMAWSSRDFAVRFLRELRRLGFPQVVLYANTTMLRAIQAWTIGEQIGGGLLIWAANYGNNDGLYNQADVDRLRGAYPHPVWIHQFSSTVPVPGFSGRVDGNKMLHPLGEDDDVTLAQEKIRFWQEANGPLGEAAGWYELPADQAIGWIHNYSQGAATNAAVSAANTQAILLHVTGDEFDEERYRTILGEELDKRPTTMVLTDSQLAQLSEVLQLDEETVKRALADVLRRGVEYFPPADAPGDTPAPQG